MDELISRQETLDTIARVGLFKHDVKEVQAVAECLREVEKLKPVTSHPKWNIPFLLHKELEIPIYEAQKAYEVAIDYLRSKAYVRG